MPAPRRDAARVRKRDLRPVLVHRNGRQAEPKPLLLGKPRYRPRSAVLYGDLPRLEGKVGRPEPQVLLLHHRRTHTVPHDQVRVEPERANPLRGVHQHPRRVHQPVHREPTRLVDERVELHVAERETVLDRLPVLGYGELARDLPQLLPVHRFLGVEVRDARAVEEVLVEHVDADRDVRGHRARLPFPCHGIHGRREVAREIHLVALDERREVREESARIPLGPVNARHADDVRRLARPGRLRLHLEPILRPGQRLDADADVGVQALESAAHRFDRRDLRVASPERKPERDAREFLTRFPLTKQEHRREACDKQRYESHSLHNKGPRPGNPRTESMLRLDFRVQYRKRPSEPTTKSSCGQSLPEPSPYPDIRRKTRVEPPETEKTFRPPGAPARPPWSARPCPCRPARLEPTTVV